MLHRIPCLSCHHFKTCSMVTSVKGMRHALDQQRSAFGFAMMQDAVECANVGTRGTAACIVVICEGCTMQIKARAVKLGLNCSFQGARDHMDDSIAGYRVFVNASTSDVVATTSAEALAMGKWSAPRAATPAPSSNHLPAAI